MVNYLSALCIAGLIHDIHPPALVRPNEPIYIGWAFPTDKPCEEIEEVPRDQKATETNRMKEANESH